jgi:hypothetical protein
MITSKDNGTHISCSELVFCQPNNVIIELSSKLVMPLHALACCHEISEFLRNLPKAPMGPKIRALKCVQSVLKQSLHEAAGSEIRFSL